MRASKLKDFVTIEYPANLKSAGGDVAASWQPLYQNLRCAVIDIIGTETQDSDTTLHTGKIRIELRAGLEIKESYRAVVGGKAYNIKHVSRLGDRRQELHLFCEVYE